MYTKRRDVSLAWATPFIEEQFVSNQGILKVDACCTYIVWKTPLIISGDYQHPIFILEASRQDYP